MALVVACVATLAVLSTIELEIASGSVVPTQVAFVPLIFAVPPGLIPALTIAAYLAGTLLTSGRSARAVLLSVASCWFAVGPALLLLATGEVSGARMIAVGLVALLAQTAFDLANWLIGVWAAGEPLPRLAAGRVGLLAGRQPDTARAGRCRRRAASSGSHRSCRWPSSGVLLHAPGRARRARITSLAIALVGRTAAPRCCSAR